MNKQQKGIISLAVNLGVICFSIIAASTATFAWFSEFTRVKATNIAVKVTGPDKNVNWDILKYDDDQKAGISYHDEKEFFLPSYDRYIQERNVYSNCIIKAIVNPPSGFDDTQQLYVDISSSGNLYNGSTLNNVTSNICQFKTTVYSYIDYTNTERIINTSIDGTNADTQYRTATDFFAATDSGSLPFVTVHNNTAMKDRDKMITLIPRFNCGDEPVKQFVVYIECSYRQDLVDFYLSKLGGDSSGETIDLNGDIDRIKFRFGPKYTGTYTRVTAQNQLTRGDKYMVMYDSFNAALDGSGDQSQYFTNEINYIEVERNGSKIRNNETVNDADWTWTSNSNLQSHSGFNIGRAAGGTGMAASTATNYANTLTYTGTENMTSVSSNYYLRYNSDENQTRFGYYGTSSANMPVQFYKYGDTAADNIKFDHILLSGTYQTTFNIGDVFQHNGMVVTAYYDDGSHKVVTGQCAWTGYNMNAICEQTITVSYTEDGVTQNASYTIDVRSEPTVYVDPTTLIGLVNGIGTLHATSVSFDGPVTYTWTNNNNTVARLATSTGETVRVAFVSAGFCTITCTATDGVNTAECEISVRVTGSQTNSDAYVKVTKASDITTGDYLIVNEDVSGALDGTMNDAIDSPQNYLTVSINRNQISSTTQNDALAFHYDATTHALTNRDGYYLGNDTNTNKIKLDSTPYECYLAWDVDHSTIRCPVGARNNVYMRFNTAIAQKRFRFYTDVNYASPIQLYKKTEDAGIKDLVRIEIEDYKTEFYTRDQFAFNGVVYAIFSDGTQENVTADAIFTGYDMEKSGQQQVTVAYIKEGVTKTAVYNITLTDPALTSITVSTVKAQTEYYQYEPFNGSDVEVTAHYANGSTKLLTSGYTFISTGSITESTGQRDVTVNYNEGGLNAQARYRIRIYAAQGGWRKITRVSDLADGNHILVVAKMGNVCMSSLQTEDFREETTVSKVNLNCTTMGNPVGPITVGADGNGRWTLYDPLNNGYLAATSSINKSLETVPAASSQDSHWNISILGNGEATIKSNGTNTNNTIRYNDIDHLFSCYEPTEKKEVFIYKYFGTYIAPIINVQSIGLSSTMLVLNVGDTRQLNVIFYPYTATDQTYTMTSGNGSVCSVSSTGLVTALGAGESVIYVTSNDGAKTAQCHVAVNANSLYTQTSGTGLYSDYLLNNVSFIMKGGHKA